jgi:truncated hemoglobin YjbI
MREAHRALHLTDEHMDRFLELAAESLTAVRVAPSVAREVVDLLERLRPVIVDAYRG